MFYLFVGHLSDSEDGGSFKDRSQIIAMDWANLGNLCLLTILNKQKTHVLTYIKTVAILLRLLILKMAEFFDCR